MDSWTPIPGFPGYEMNLAGQVRSWRLRGNNGDFLKRANEPHGLRVKMSQRSESCYTLSDAQGVPHDYQIDVLYAMVFGLQSERVLSRFHRAEIRALEGIRTAREVAREFGIDAAQVREIWDEEYMRRGLKYALGTTEEVEGD